jgi:hypothetical protein
MQNSAPGSLGHSRSVIAVLPDVIEIYNMTSNMTSLEVAVSLELN